MLTLTNTLLIHQPSCFPLKLYLHVFKTYLNYWFQRKIVLKAKKWRNIPNFFIFWCRFFPYKNYCINYVSETLWNYKKGKLIGSFLRKLLCTCSSRYEIKVVFMKMSSNPYFDNDVFWHKVVFLFLAQQYIFQTRFAIPNQIVNIMEMIKILGWFIKEVTYWCVWNK